MSHCHFDKKQSKTGECQIAQSSDLPLIHPTVSPIVHPVTIVIHGEHEHSSFNSDTIAHIRLTQIHR